MSERKWWLVWMAVLLGCGTVAAVGNLDREVSLDSVSEVWSDVLRDGDKLGMKVARVSSSEEIRLGADLAKGLAGVWPEDAQAGAYVAAVGKSLTPRLQRPAIQYRFHVIESPYVNAFALPGGEIYVTNAMLGFLTSEAELAVVIGHEMSHVDLKHCIGRYQYQIALKKVGAPAIGQIADFARQLITIGYSQGQELDADAQGARLSIEAGYDPDAGPRVFDRMWNQMSEPRRTVPDTPVAEVLGSVDGAISGYFRSHPASAKRAERLRELTMRNRQRLADHVFYIGAKNYAQRVARSEQEFPEERVRAERKH